MGLCVRSSIPTTLYLYVDCKAVRLSVLSKQFQSLESVDKMSERLYHLVSVNVKHGKKGDTRSVYLTAYPMSHKECCTMKGKFTEHAHRMIQLEEVTNEN
jgi:hypothetical protein